MVRATCMFLYLFVLSEFAVCFVFGCVASICNTCCQTDEDVFLICWCFFYCMCFLRLQYVELSRPSFIVKSFSV